MANLLNSRFAGGCLKPSVPTPRALQSTKIYAKAGNWAPGTDTPKYLEDLPGSFGFDPLGLGRNPDLLQRFQESELVHSRWAMLGVAGCLAVELAGQGNWFDAPRWVLEGTKPTYLGVEVPLDFNTILAVEGAAIAFSEAQRNGEPDKEKKKYPGGPFDPLGFSKNAAQFEEYKLKEIKNGRLAMLAFLGFVSQHSLYKRGPLQDLASHLADPWRNNFATNGFSFPFYYN